MIKLTFCLRRLPHLSREQFQTYWREQHAPLVAKHAANSSEAAAAAGRELLEDEQKFIDLANSPLWFGDEHVIVG